MHLKLTQASFMITEKHKSLPEKETKVVHVAPVSRRENNAFLCCQL